MEIKLNIWADNSSKEPSKTYVINRILFKTAKELASISEEAKNEENDPIGMTCKMLKVVFPDFKDEDIDYIDPIEFGEVMQEITKSVKAVMANAQKN